MQVLLRFCSNTTLTFFLRAMPPSVTLPAAERHDELIDTALYKLVGGARVGAAGTRNLSRELVWWRGAPSRTTLAGLVHHGASRAFFGPYGGVVMLDGLFLAARGRTLRAVRLGPPAALEGELAADERATHEVLAALDERRARAAERCRAATSDAAAEAALCQLHLIPR